VIGSFAVSVDSGDPTSQTMNFLFVGNEAGHHFFEEEEANMSAFLYEFETYCQYVLFSIVIDNILILG